MALRSRHAPGAQVARCDIGAADLIAVTSTSRRSIFCRAPASCSSFTPTAGVAIPLLPGRRSLAVLGAVGQPRDHNPAACYALLDEAQNMLTYIRVPYDVASAARKIRDAGLPAVLAARLEQGY